MAASRAGARIAALLCLALLGSCRPGEGNSLPETIVLQATADSPNVVSLRWSASTAAGTDYRILRDGHYITGLIGLNTLFIDYFATPATRFCYEVQVVIWPTDYTAGRSNQACVTTQAVEAGWQFETVAAIGVRGGGPALAVDAAGNAHVSYVAANGSDLAYASDVGGSWASTVVAGDADLGSQTSLAIDPGGGAHVVYIAGGGIRAGTNAAGTWGFAELPAGRMPALALDGGVEHVAYVDASGYSIHHVTNASGSWVDETIFGGLWNGNFRLGPQAAVIDGTGALHVAAVVELAAGDGLEYLTNAAGGWEAFLATQGAVLGSAGAALSLSSDGTAHVTYWVGQPAFALVVASGSGAGWQASEVDRFFWFGFPPTLARGPGDSVYVAYADANRCVKVATNAGGPWRAAWIECGVAAFQVTGIAVDAAGRVHLLYTESAGRTIRHARR